jgi:hypothetical protein
LFLKNVHLYFSPFKNVKPFEEKKMIEFCYLIRFQRALFSLEHQAHALIINGFSND